MLDSGAGCGHGDGVVLHRLRIEAVLRAAAGDLRDAGQQNSRHHHPAQTVACATPAYERQQQDCEGQGSFALEGMTEALWQELEPLGLRAFLVEPGSFRTGIEQRTRFSGEPIEAYDSTSGAFRRTPPAPSR